MNTIFCHRLIDVTTAGITLESNKQEIYISLEDCVKNFDLEIEKGYYKCVGTRDITTLTFSFYTQPKTNVVFKKSFLKDIILGRSAINKFLDLQKAIIEVGYTTYDLS